MPDKGLNGLFERVATPAVLSTGPADSRGRAGGPGARPPGAAAPAGAAASRPRTGWQARVVEGSVLVVAPFVALIVLLAGARRAAPGGPRRAADRHRAAVRRRIAAHPGRSVPGDAGGGPRLLAAAPRVRRDLRPVGSADASRTWAGSASSRARSTRVDLIPGKTHFTPLGAAQGPGRRIRCFVVISSLVSQTLERRVMKIEALAMSTRIGISKFTYFFLITLGVLIGINAAGRRPHRPDRADRRHRHRPGIRPAVHRQQFRQRLRAADGQVDQAGRRHQLHRHDRHEHRRTSAGCRNCAAATSWCATATAWRRWCRTRT